MARNSHTLHLVSFFQVFVFIRGLSNVNSLLDLFTAVTSARHPRRILFSPKNV